jgi:SAM-dependent methyltransferase
VLEVGCGDGEVLEALVANFDEVVGVELSVNRVRNARKRLAGGRGAEVYEGNIEHGLPFPDGSFDCVSWADVVEHVLDVWTALDEIARLLSPGGRLVTVTPNVAGIRKRVTLLRGRFPSTSGKDEGLTVRPGELFDGGHLHYFTYSSLEGVCRRAGLIPAVRLGFGRFGRLHDLRPALLSGSVAVVAQKPRPICAK